MRLQAQAPLRVLQAKNNTRLNIMVIGLWVFHLHGLNKKMLKIIVGKFMGGERFLRVNEFQFMSAILHERTVRFGADTYPIQMGGRYLCAIGLDTVFQSHAPCTLPEVLYPVEAVAHHP